jgi:hypothetical protein
MGSGGIVMVALINRHVAVLSIAFLSFAALLLARPASAASLGFTAKCSFMTMTALRCDIPVLSSEYNVEIEYFSMQCDNSAGAPFTLAQFEILATPPNGTSEAAYQPEGNRSAVGGVVNTAGDVHIFVKAKTTSEALIELTPAPSGRTSCTVSVSATY